MTRLALALVAAVLLGGCGAANQSVAEPTLPVIETVPETTEAAMSAADRRRCREFSRGVERAKKHLAELKRDGPPPPVDGYDFTEDYNLELFETEQELDFYLGELNSPPCAPDEGYPSDESGYEPDPPDEPEPDPGP
jgi:hypothetical protein